MLPLTGRGKRSTTTAGVGAVVPTQHVTLLALTESGSTLHNSEPIGKGKAKETKKKITHDVRTTLSPHHRLFH